MYDHPGKNFLIQLAKELLEAEKEKFHLGGRTILPVCRLNAALVPSAKALTKEAPEEKLETNILETINAH